MNAETYEHYKNLQHSNADTRYQSFQYILNATHKPVGWAYEVWDELLELLKNRNNHQRAIAAQVLCNLAKSDPESRMLQDLDKLLAVTYDEKFVTARHSLQCLWKVAIVSNDLQQLITERLSSRFAGCTDEKNCTLIRYDILEIFRKVYDKTKDEALVTRSLDLIASEPDIKFRKKYTGLWKDVINSKGRSML